MSNARHTNRLESPTVEELYERYADRLRRLVGFRAATTDQNCEDACSYAWTQLIEKRPVAHGDLFPWLATVAIRQAWQLARADRSRIGSLNDEVIGSEEPKFTGVDADDLVAALAQMNERRRRLLVQRLAGWTLYEIADAEGISYKRAWQLVERARQELVDLLGGDRRMRG